MYFRAIIYNDVGIGIGRVETTELSKEEFKELISKTKGILTFTDLNDEVIE